MAHRVGVRWTVGDVSPLGFEALRLSVWGAWRLFGPDAGYAVCANSVDLDRARELTGPLPPVVEWHRSTEAELPGFIAERLDAAKAEGVGWKFAPLRLFPDRHEIALDNDCILWSLPPAMERWLAASDPDRCLFAEDVCPCFGQFAALAGEEPRNSGIRGVPPDFDLAGALREVLDANPVTLVSELDEQGLQAAAVATRAAPEVVRVDAVTICSPFPPHLPHLGRCGAHFVGLNARSLPWEFDGRPASEYIRENFGRHRTALYQRVGAAAA